MIYRQATRTQIPYSHSLFSWEQGMGVRYLCTSCLSINHVCIDVYIACLVSGIHIARGFMLVLGTCIDIYAWLSGLYSYFMCRLVTCIAMYAWFSVLYTHIYVYSRDSSKDISYLNWLDVYPSYLYNHVTVISLYKYLVQRLWLD
jgi:hypothetical protein